MSHSKLTTDVHFLPVAAVQRPEFPVPYTCRWLTQLGRAAAGGGALLVGGTHGHPTNPSRYQVLQPHPTCIVVPLVQDMHALHSKLEPALSASLFDECTPPPFNTLSTRAGAVTSQAAPHMLPKGGCLWDEGSCGQVVRARIGILSGKEVICPVGGIEQHPAGNLQPAMAGRRR